MLTTIMNIFMKKKVLPCPTGPYATAFADLMTEFSQDGVFVRLYYPSTHPEHTKKESHRPTWVPHDKYVKGLAYVVGVWVIIIRLIMWWYGGVMHIPAILEGKLLPLSQRKDNKLPVIIFSHGFGAARFLCSNMLNELASQGYVVAALEHRDRSACATYYYQSAGHRDQDVRSWLPHDRLKLGAEHLQLRQKQVKQRRDECVKALDLLAELNQGSNASNILPTTLNLRDFEGQLEMDQVTIIGHSFGGATALMCLATDSRFRQGVILDGWMYPLKDDTLEVPQPLLIINSPTFHIPSNLLVFYRFIENPPGAQRQIYTIKMTTHETPTDSPYVFGYWLDTFKKKVSPKLGSAITNFLIITFLQQYNGVPENTESVQLVLKNQNHLIVEGSMPPPVLPKRNFSLW